MIDGEPNRGVPEPRWPNAATVTPNAARVTPTAVRATPNAGRIVPIPTVRIGRPSRQPGALAALVAVFLVLAITKPWAGPVRPNVLVQGSFTIPSSTPATVGVNPIVAELQLQCGEPLGWRVFTREGFLDRTIRAWRFVEPVASVSGPLDPAVPVVQVGPTIEALGYCSSWSDGERPPDGAMVSAWRISGPDRPDPTAVLVPLDSLVPEWPIDLGALFGPGTANGAAASARPDPSGDRRPGPSGGPSGDPGPLASPGTGARPSEDPGNVGDRHLNWGTQAVAGSPAWSLGRYVFAVRAPGWERWWAVNISRPGPA